ncbi:hypothetical protein P3T76_008596 [Phytophthora citrophthora]|uniref:Uncharacterized protein n=1 Tax=Phytophthora citrophthora TaxID=4793 RepID=A0AAD9GIT8_9STRA|nr:hypothetical protein P3T76_008596 [Phytophthora citrophthora]
MRVREGPGHMVVKYADGKPRRVPRRSATFSYEFDGFHGSDDVLVIKLSGSFAVSRVLLVTSLISTGWLELSVRVTLM